MPDEKHAPFGTGLAPLSGFVYEAEQARAFLQTELDYARGETAAELEMLLFYGRAFAQVIRRLPHDGLGLAWQERLLQEAVLGRTVYWEWQRRTTSLVASQELSQMQLRWASIVASMAEIG